MKNLYLGDRGVLVQYLQLALNRAGFPVTINGEFNGKTCIVLKSFYESKKVTGERVGCYVDNSSWNLLIPYLKGYTTHIVKAGDTIWSIAQKYGTQTSDILIANPQTDVLNLRLGSLIYVPFGFSLVSDEVDYSYWLQQLIIEGLLVRYPFLESASIGSSVMGKDIPYVKIGSGSTQVFYNASFHANEWITTPIMLKFIEDYAFAYSNYQNLYGEIAQSLFERFSLYIVPMVNPDGVDLVNGVLGQAQYEAQAKEIAARYPQIPFPGGWKANIDGIDLNLQFPAGWENARRIKYVQGYTTPSPRDFVGEGPLTAIESKNVYEFTLEHDFRLIFAYHTQGEVIYWKYLDYEPDNSRQIAQYFSNVSGYKVANTPMESGYAGYKDWFIMQYNRPGYTIEAGLGENPLPMTQFSKIYADNVGILLGGMTQIS